MADLGIGSREITSPVALWDIPVQTSSIEAITRFWNKKIRLQNKEGPPPRRIVAMLATSMPHDATFVDKKINRDPNFISNKSKQKN